MIAFLDVMIVMNIAVIRCTDIESLCLSLLSQYKINMSCNDYNFHRDADYKALSTWLSNLLNTFCQG